MPEKTMSEPLQERSQKAQLENHKNGETAVAHTKTTKSEDKYQALFEASPVSLWEVDFSRVKQFIDQLRQQEVADFRAYFNANPQDVFRCTSFVRVKDVNQAAVNLYKAASKKELLNNLGKVFGLGTLDMCREDTLFKEELITMGAGKTSFESEGIHHTLENETLNVLLRWSVSPGCEETFSQVIVSILDITSQKQAEEQMRLQATALESVANAIVVTDKEGDILWVNPAFTKLTGYSYEEALGKNPRILNSGQTSKLVYQELWQTILAGEVWHCEEIINQRKDGSFYYEQMTVTPVKDDNGQITRFVAIKEDITERKLIELQLRQQLQEEELLRQIVAINPGVDQLNEALTLICGKLATFYELPSISFTLLDKDAMLADILGEYLAPALLDDNYQIVPLVNILPIDNLLQLKSVKYIPNVQKAAQFEQVWDILQAFDNHSALLVPVPTVKPSQGLLVFDTVQPKKFSQDDIDFIEQVATHIGQMLQRIQTEQKLQKQQDFARQVMNNMGQGLLVLRAGRTIDFCNSAFANLVGYDEQDLFGRSLMDFVKLDAQEQILGPTPAERDVQKSMRELKLVHADGSQISVLITAVPRNDDIVKNGAICVVTDLSAQKEIENALAQARDQALETTRLKSEFLANMSHEIRTPLNAVVGMTSLMLDSPLTQEQQEYAQTIRSSSEVLLTLINDILDFSKIEAGKLELEQRPFSVRDCVEEALDVVVTKAAEKGLELAYIIEDDVPNDILGDVTRVRQILVNLLNNAIKFTDIGEVVLSVSCRKEECPEDSTGETILHFSVKDTGIGILPKRLNRLFKSFSQVDTSTTRKHGGTGLGLAISKQLVEMMGGHIWVESEYEKGSTFHFTIATQPVASQRRVYMQKSLPQLRGKQLLIVDDNQTNCRILQKQAASWGMVPTAVFSGAEALALLEKGDSFDLAILDMQMPEMDGMMLAAEIRKLCDKQSLPLVMLSSIGAHDAHKEANHFSAYLTKPAKQQSLFETLTAVLSDTAVSNIPLPQKLTINPDMGKNHPLRILLAEDNLVNQKVALRILERMGYRADVAGDGLEVLESLQRQPYDVVLMDVQMPYMDGVEATEQIRDIWPPEEQPAIVAMTANALIGDREKYLMAGMDNYISKPVRIQELLEALATVTPLSVKQKR